ncbi:MAG: glutathionylspermidine synthase family protein, partial [Burkholderiales bacterium]
MQREKTTPRRDWRRRCEEVGFHYHTIDGTYWDESVCYRFDADQIDALEAATSELHRLCLEACEHVVKRKRLAEFAIPAEYQSLVIDSWRAHDPTLFGRFDLAWTGSGAPKLLEYNADTPTALLEASVVQWQWMEDVKPGSDQFNSIHEKLIAHWGAFRALVPKGDPITFVCAKDSQEDLGNLEYLRDTAMQGGFGTEQLFIEDLGWDAGDRCFVNETENRVTALFKLYPWEWLVHEAFGKYLLAKTCAMIEPPWKMLLSNKAILAVLWELFPNHENLLPAFRDPSCLTGDYVRKPILSREGANIELRSTVGGIVTAGDYGAEGFVYQAYAPIFSADGQYAVLGSWVIGDEPAGIGIR